MSYRALRREIFNDVKTLVDSMVNEIRNAEQEERGIDLTEFIQGISEMYGQMDVHFDEAMQRGEKKPKTFFG